MSRHRNVRAMDFDEEYEGYYSCYGHSVEEDFCISPRTEAQFLYNRDANNQHIGEYLNAESLNEDDDENFDHEYCDSHVPKMTTTDLAKLQSCIEALQNIVGDTIPENILSEAAKKFGYDFDKALDAVLTGVTLESPAVENPRAVDTDFPANMDKSLHVTVNKPSATYEPKVIPANLEPSADNFCPMRNNLTGAEELEKYSDSPVRKVNDIKVTQQNDGCTKRKAAVDVLKIYNQERGSEKPLLNLVVIGHVDAGKSTLMGHLLFRLGCVSKKTMHKYEQDSKKLGKSSFMYAWVLDETSEERNRGITMDVAQSKFETQHRSVNLLDAPGHKDFIPNMITGAAQADVAVLVVDATRGEFETGFDAGGQTREHTMLVRSLGVSQLAVAVNKMDNVNWDKQRYDEIVKKLLAFLKQAGFKDSDVWFVPCSGLTGQNLTDSTNQESGSWYSGQSLVEVIDHFKPPERLVLKPMRMFISDVFKGMSGGFCVSGRVETGFVQNGDKLVVMPSGEQVGVKGISVNDITVTRAYAGDHVVLQIHGVDISNVVCGNVLCEINNPVKVSNEFEARLVIFDVAVPITKGFPVVIHYQSLNEQAVIKKLLSQLHRSTGEVIKNHPRCISKHSSAVVEIKVSRPVCLELYQDYKELGRFMLRSGGSTIAAGIVTKVF